MTCMNQQWHYRESGPHWGFEIVNDEGRTVAQVYADDLTGQMRAERIARLMVEASAMAAELRETLDLLRAIIDNGILKTATNITALLGDVMRNEAHERIATTRTILARIDGATP